MQNNGYVEAVAERENVFAGMLQTLSLNMKIALMPNNERRSERSPDFVVVTRRADGSRYDIGAAWRYQIKEGDRAGKDMFSISLNDAELPRLSFAAWPDDDQDGRFYLTSDRSREPVTVDDTGERARAGQLDDEIPF